MCHTSVNCCSRARDTPGTARPCRSRTLVVPKEDSMRRLLLSLIDELMHEIGTGRALDNARHENDEVARTVAVVDALAGRLQTAALVEKMAEERVAA